MQVQRNLSGNYYTESLMSSSLIRDDKALTSLAKISCTRKKNWFTVYFLNRGFKTHTFLCGSPSSLPVILKASRHKTIYNNRLCWGLVKSIQFHSFTSILTKTIKCCWGTICITYLQEHGREEPIFQGLRWAEINFCLFLTSSRTLFSWEKYFD